MPIEAVKIPQNVYIEDRIVGPLTLRQIITVAIGCGFSYAVWASLSKTYGNLGVIPTIILFIPGALSFLFAFVTINDISLLRMVLLTIERMNKPSVRVWGPRTGIQIHIRTFGVKDEDDKKKAEPVQAPTRLEDLTTVLDSPIRTLHHQTVAVPAAAPANVNVRVAEPDDGLDELELPVLRPARRDAVSAEPLDSGRAVDGMRPSAGGPIFRDLSPA